MSKGKRHVHQDELSSLWLLLRDVYNVNEPVRGLLYHGLKDGRLSVGDSIMVVNGTTKRYVRYTLGYKKSFTTGVYQHDEPRLITGPGYWTIWTANEKRTVLHGPGQSACLAQSSALTNQDKEKNMQQANVTAETIYPKSVAPETHPSAIRTARLRLLVTVVGSTVTDLKFHMRVWGYASERYEKLVLDGELLVAMTYRIDVNRRIELIRQHWDKIAIGRNTTEQDNILDLIAQVATMQGAELADFLHVSSYLSESTSAS